MKLYLLLLAAIAYLPTADTTICHIEPITTMVNGKAVVFGASDMPCYKVDDFKKAVNLAVRAIYSDEFEAQLTKHIQSGIGRGLHARAWRRVVAANVVRDMRLKIIGLTAETYEDEKAFNNSGNLAYDGTTSGPIRLNSFPLRERTPADIANTIAHETAHRIGLRHPHSCISLKIAAKEPPYVIGKIVEDIAEKLPAN